MEGKDVRAKKIWQDLAVSEMRLWMMNEEMMKNKLRREIGKPLTRNSKPYRVVMRRLKRVADEVKGEYRQTYEEKIYHLRRRQEENNEQKEKEIPKEMSEYSDLSIFSKEKF